MAHVDGKLTIAVVPVELQLDFKALATAVKDSGARMVDVRQAERTAGYVAGGISPLGQKRPLPTMLDDARHATRRSPSQPAGAGSKSSWHPPT